MTQLPLSIEFPLNLLEELVLKSIVIHSGIIRSNLAEILAKDHGIEKLKTIEIVMVLSSMRLITMTNEQLHPVKGLKIENGKARVGGAA